MKMTSTRLMLALVGGLMCTGPAQSANELRFSDLETRLAVVEQEKSRLTTVAFLSDGQAIDAIAPNEPSESGSSEDETSSPLTAPLENYSSTSESCGTSRASGTPCACDSAPSGGYFGQVELMFLRPHMAEFAVGKLSENYELAPRLVAGYETAGGVGARVRYWTVGRTTQILDDDVDIRFEFDVYDVEATSRFRTKRSEIVVGGGFRFARLDIDLDGESVSSDLPGLTFAADLRTFICGDCRWEWSAVCGARLSLLGGDWEGSGDALILPVRDDNIVTQELYGGVEYVQRLGTCNVFTRLVFEMQNWHSDALAQSGGTDSIGLVGPGIHAGATF